MKKISKLEEDVKIIFKILSKFFIKDSYWFKDEIVFFPMGTIVKEKSKWILDVDLSSVNPGSLVLIFYLIKDILKKFNIEFGGGYYSIFHPEKEVCCGCVFEEEVLDYVEKFGVDYHNAFEILSLELIDNFDREEVLKEVLN